MARSNLAYQLFPKAFCAYCDNSPLPGRKVCAEHTGDVFFDDGAAPPTNIVRYDAGKPRRPAERVDISKLLIKGKPVRPEDNPLQAPVLDAFCIPQTAEPEQIKSVWSQLFS